jgi:endonuclease/exonuclease/phosphatase (EEP) superfamily protein YafD
MERERRVQGGPSVVLDALDPGDPAASATQDDPGVPRHREQVSGRSRRLVTVGAWTVVALLGWVMIARLLRRTWPVRVTLVLQTVTPLTLLPSLVVLGLALGLRRRLLAVASVALILVQVAAVVPAVRGEATPNWAEGAPTVRVLSANVYDANASPAAAARAVLAADADVLALAEVGPDVAAALQAAGADERYPYRVSNSFADAAAIGVIYSRIPFRDAMMIHLGDMWLPTAVIDVDDVPLRVLGVHVTDPTRSVHDWREELSVLRDYARSVSGPLVMAGDFNASRWNPQFHDLLDVGLRDATETTGRGLTSSWPVGRLLPFPIMRLDHALGNGSVVAVADRDVRVPGSDHLASVTEWAVRTDPPGG